MSTANECSAGERQARGRDLDSRHPGLVSSAGGWDLDQPGQRSRLGVPVEPHLAPLAAEHQAQPEPADDHSFTVQAARTGATLFAELRRNRAERKFDGLVLPHCRPW